MVVYSITDIENLSGIKAHTLRVWEKRYGVLVAKRTSANIRYYTEDDLKYALNLSILYRKGLKISTIAKYSRDDFCKKVAEIKEQDDAFEKSLDSLSISMMELNEYKFVSILNRNIEQKGFDHTMEKVIYPLLEKINLMWVAGSINEVHEIFVLNIIKQKIIVEIDKLPIEKKCESDKFLLYLPENESQKLSMYYMYYILKRERFSVFLLGDGVKYERLMKAVELVKPDYVFTIVNDSLSGKALQPYVNKICNELDVKLVLSGYQAMNQSVVASDKCKIMTTIDSVMRFMDNLKKNNFVSNS